MSTKNLDQTLVETQTHCISMLSNICFGFDASHQSLQDYAAKAMPAILGEQSITQFIGTNNVVWGPSVFSVEKTPKTVADNTLCVTYNAANNHYVVGIAGTNIDSLYGWFVEDFETMHTEAWSDVSPNAGADSGRIAKGTSIGLKHLLAMTDPQTGLTLVEFLSSISSGTGCTLSVGGHSLGGTLTPTLATYLIEDKGNWDKGNRFTSINAYPTAGATPGNATFAGYVETLFNNNSNYHYLGKYNRKDVVPHAWEKKMMLVIEGIYFLDGEPTPQPIFDIVAGEIAKTAATNYQQIQPLDKLKGDYHVIPQSEINKAVAGVPQDIKDWFTSHGYDLAANIEFFMELGYQHTTEYNGLLGIVPFQTAFNDYRAANKPAGAVTKSEIEVLIDVIKYIIKHFKKTPENS